MATGSRVMLATWHWHIEISSKCTLKCPRCARQEVPDTLINTELDLDFFKKNFTKEFVLSNVEKITFCGDDGDPIYAHDLIPVIKYLKDIKPIEIVIITNDNDYLQLVDKNISIINMQFKDISLRGNKNAKSNLHYKAIYGDKSDNIQKIASSITKDKALVLAELNDTDLNQWLTENNLLEKFMFNMNLISFEKIPVEYVKKFYENMIITVI